MTSTLIKSNRKFKAIKLLSIFVATFLVVVSVIVLLRVGNLFMERMPRSDYYSEIQVNNGYVIADGIGLLPRNESVIVASHPESNVVLAASRTRTDIIAVDLESGQRVAKKSLLDMGLGALEGISGKTIRLFDLQATKSDLYISFVASDFSGSSCDIYGIFSIQHANFVLANRGSEVWRSDVCRSANTSTYNWPDFTGRLAIVGDSIFLTSGLSSMDMLLETWPEVRMSGFEPTLEQELASNELFGSLTKIEIQTGKSEQFARGFRSPSGIAVRRFGGQNQIWVADHGPRGGDELNLISKGGDYGWPWVSLGTNYGVSKSSNNFTKFGTHIGFVQPEFSWTPSIAPSNLFALSNSTFRNQDWQISDLVLGTLKDKSLHILKIGQDSRVLTTQRVFIDHRIRDCGETRNGIVMGTDDGMLVALTPKDRQLSDENEVGTFPAITTFSWQETPVIGSLVSLADSIVGVLVKLWQEVFS